MSDTAVPHVKHYRRNDASKYLLEKYDISRVPATLAKYACRGGGPRYKLAGKTPIYPEDELDVWAKSILSPMKTSTSDTSESQE